MNPSPHQYAQQQTSLEENLHASAALQTAILNGANYAIIATTAEGVIQIFNPAAQILFGYHTSEVVNTATPLLFHDPHEIIERAARYTETYGRGIVPDYEVLTVVARLGLVDESEWTAVRKDGSRFPVFVSITALYDENENITGYLHITSDITHRKRAEEELINALKKEKELSEIKSGVVTMVSHEFRTPLATILSSMEMLQRYGENWTEEKAMKAEKHYRRVRESILRLTSLLDDALLIGKADSGNMTYTPATLSLTSLCHSIAEELDSVAAQSGIRIQCTIDGGLTEFTGDEKLLHHIVTNILSNAVKYSPTGSIVEFFVYPDEPWIFIIVRDHGIGIGDDDLPYVFEPFRRAKNVGTIQGTGIGLSIVKRCVELHGGTVAVKSAIGEGTTVTISLPSVHPSTHTTATIND
jgi:PAS domain S-box-containing protein